MKIYRWQNILFIILGSFININYYINAMIERFRYHNKSDCIQIRLRAPSTLTSTNSTSLNITLHNNVLQKSQKESKPVQEAPEFYLSD